MRLGPAVLVLLACACAEPRPRPAPPGTAAGRQTASASCPLSALGPEDWKALAALPLALTPASAAALAPEARRELCLSRRLFHLVEQAEDKERFSGELVPEDLPEGLRRYLSDAEYERVRPVVERLGGRRR